MALRAQTYKKEYSEPLKEDKVTPAVEPAISWLDLVLVLAVAASWGLAFVGIKETALEAPPLQAAGLRFFLASIPLLFLALQPSRLGKLTARDFGKFAILGFFQTTLMFGIVYSVSHFVPAGVTSIIMNSNPFFVAIMAHFLVAGDRLRRQKVIGLLVGFAGIATLVFGGKGAGEINDLWPLVLLIGAIAWAFSSILVKLFRFKDMVSVTCWQALFGSLPLLALGFVLEGGDSIHWNANFVGWTLYTGIIASSFGWWAWYKVLSRYSASRISVFLFLVPVFGVISGVIFLGEQLSLSMLFGGALVIAGIVIVNKRLYGGTFFRRSR